MESFALLCLGACLQGVATASAQNYRFAAMLLAPSSKEKAAGRVLAGGVLGAILGPGILTRARELLPADFAGVFVCASCCHAVGFMLIASSKFPAVAAPLAAASDKPIDKVE